MWPFSKKTKDPDTLVDGDKLAAGAVVYDTEKFLISLPGDLDAEAARVAAETIMRKRFPNTRIQHRGDPILKEPAIFCSREGRRITVAEDGTEKVEQLVTAWYRVPRVLKSGA